MIVLETYKNFDNALDQEQAFGYLIEEHPYAGLFSLEEMHAILAERRAYLEGQSRQFYDSSNLEKEGYVKAELELIRCLLEPVARLKAYEEFTERDQQHAVGVFGEMAARLNSTLKEFSRHIYRLYLKGFVSCIDNYIYYLETDLVESLDKKCRCQSLFLRETALFEILNEWLEKIKYEFPDEKLTLRKNSLKEGPPPPFPTEPMVEDLFKSESKYMAFLRLLEEGNMFGEEDRKWEDCLNKKTTAQLIKTLRREGYFRRDVPLTDEIILGAFQRTFGIDISKSSFQRIHPDSKGIKDILPKK